MRVNEPQESGSKDTNTSPELFKSNNDVDLFTVLHENETFSDHSRDEVVKISSSNIVKSTPVNYVKESNGDIINNQQPNASSINAHIAHLEMAHPNEGILIILFYL